MHRGRCSIPGCKNELVCEQCPRETSFSSKRFDWGKGYTRLSVRNRPDCHFARNFPAKRYRGRGI